MTWIVPCEGNEDCVPIYQSEGASGADLVSTQEMVVKPGARALVPTGIKLELPLGMEAQVRPRSGLAVRHGVTVLNSPGTIDSDYRGEIKVILINLGSEDFVIRAGDRIAQIVFSEVGRVVFRRKDAIERTERGDGGFGSTGT